eukprot:scaffold9668_cov101-Isochrysis_galbana.AAC.4
MDPPTHLVLNPTHQARSDATCPSTGAAASVSGSGCADMSSRRASVAIGSSCFRTSLSTNQQPRTPRWPSTAMRSFGYCR